VTDALKGFVCKLFGALVQKIGWNYDHNEGFLDSLLRTLAITVAGKAGDVAVVEESKKRFQQFLAGQEDAIHPNLRGAIFSIVLQHGGAAEFDNVLKLYRETTVADQKVVALAALGSTASDDLLKRALDVSLSEDVRPQDIHYVLNAVASNPLGRVMAWEFVKVFLFRWHRIMML
jgi:aminopeptidase 2